MRDDVIALLPNIPMAMFGSFRAPFPPTTYQVLIYQKSPDAGLMGSVTGFRTDVEPVFLVGPWPIRDVRWSSVIQSRTGLQTLQAGESHPHAKPVEVMRVIISACPSGLIVDPFMGSGTTLVAAKQLGRKAIGIEIEERYCEIAAKRLSQEVLPLEPAEPAPEQAEMFT
jgi:site-specific DNA-methyltransferase (adenine-specific)